MDRNSPFPSASRYDDEPGPHVGTAAAVTVLALIMLFVAVCLWVVWPR